MRCILLCHERWWIVLLDIVGISLWFCWTGFNQTALCRHLNKAPLPPSAMELTEASEHPELSCCQSWMVVSQIISSCSSISNQGNRRKNHRAVGMSSPSCLAACSTAALQQNEIITLDGKLKVAGDIKELGGVTTVIHKWCGFPPDLALNSKWDLEGAYCQYQHAGLAHCISKSDGSYQKMIILAGIVSIWGCLRTTPNWSL